MRQVRIIGRIMAVLSLLALPARSQQPAPAGAIAEPAATAPRADTTAAARRDSLAASVLSRAGRVARGALLGAVAGGIAGEAVAFASTSSASVTDHSEDRLTYAAFGVVGALAGLLIGAVAGAVAR